MLGPARIVGDEDAHALALRRAADHGDELGDELGIAVAGDDDRHWPAVLVVPAAGHACLPTRAGPEAEQPIERSESQRKDECLVQHGAEAAVAVGEVDPAGQVGEPAGPSALQR